MTGAYYNEHDRNAAAWLRELIKGGHIAPGDVDERDIRDVCPTDLAGYAQVHCFAGIGVWSYALRQAGWPDTEPVWTGSCPCQPFSSAGRGAGFADERHLWPYWHHLIRVCRPRVVFGEQVASRDGLTWLDLVQTDLEGEGYACGALDLCAAGFGAPHIRQRLFFVADGDGRRRLGRSPKEPLRLQGTSERGSSGSVADAISGRVRGGGCREAERAESGLQGADGERQRLRSHAQSGGGDVVCGLADPLGAGELRVRPCGGEGDGPGAQGRDAIPHGCGSPGLPSPTGPVNGFWRASDWLYCRDERWRPVEPSTFPLAHGAAARLVRLRGYGNALCAPVAAAFIAAYRAVREGAAA